MEASPAQTRRGGSSGTRQHFSFWIALLAPGFLLLSSATTCWAQLSYPLEDREMLPTGFVTFPRQCSTEKVEDTRLLIQKELFYGKDPFDGFPDSHIDELLEKKIKLHVWASNASVFQRLMKETRPRVVVEVGTFLGASAIHLASIADSMGLQPVIICIDDFRGIPWMLMQKQLRHIPQLHGATMLYETFLHNVKAKGFHDAILPVPYDSAQALDFLCDIGIQADLIEIDGGHDFHSAWSDINRAYKLLAPGGIMFGNDFYNSEDRSGMWRAVQLFAQINKLQVEPDGNHWILRNPYGYGKILKKDTTTLTRTFKVVDEGEKGSS